MSFKTGCPKGRITTGKNGADTNTAASKAREMDLAYSICKRKRGSTDVAQSDKKSRKAEGACAWWLEEKGSEVIFLRKPGGSWGKWREGFRKDHTEAWVTPS